jgi:RNA-directed DNA polymerase
VERLKAKRFRPIPARRVYIQKGDGTFRPLGISPIENKIVERGTTWILESINEQDFSNQSFGFRPKRNAHQALKELNELVMFKPVNHVVEAATKYSEGIQDFQHSRIPSFQLSQDSSIPIRHSYES